MGYQTEVRGEILFSRELKASEIIAIKNLFWIDEFPQDSDMSGGKPHYIQFELTKNMDGFEWDGSEKFYNIPEAVAFVINNCGISDLNFKGVLECQGEEMDDRYKIVVLGRSVVEKKIKLDGIVTCPHSDEKFQLKDEA